MDGPNPPGALVRVTPNNFSVDRGTCPAGSFESSQYRGEPQCVPMRYGMLSSVQVAAEEADRYLDGRRDAHGNAEPDPVPAQIAKSYGRAYGPTAELREMGCVKKSLSDDTKCMFDSDRFPIGSFETPPQ